MAQLMMLLQQVQPLADATQHAQRQNIHLQDAQRVDVILVPADDGAVLHRGVFHRHKLVQPPLGDDEAADMLAEVPGKALNLVDQLQGQHQAPIRRVQPDLAQPHLGDLAGATPAPDLARHGRERILGQAHGAAHLAHGALAAIVDHRGA